MDGYADGLSFGMTFRAFMVRLGLHLGSDFKIWNARDSDFRFRDAGAVRFELPSGRLLSSQGFNIFRREALSAESPRITAHIFQNDDRIGPQRVCECPVRAQRTQRTADTTRKRKRIVVTS